MIAADTGGHAAVEPRGMGSGLDNLLSVTVLGDACVRSQGSVVRGQSLSRQWSVGSEEPEVNGQSHRASELQ